MSEHRGTITYGVEHITKLLEHLAAGQTSFEQAEGAADLLVAFMRLPQDQRAILYLKAAGYADDEIARHVWGTRQRWKVGNARRQALDDLVDRMNGIVRERRARKRGKRGETGAVRAGV